MRRIHSELLWWVAVVFIEGCSVFTMNCCGLAAVISEEFGVLHYSDD